MTVRCTHGLQVRKERLQAGFVADPVMQGKDVFLAREACSQQGVLEGEKRRLQGQR